MNFKIAGFNECMIVYLLAVAGTGWLLESGASST